MASKSIQLPAEALPPGTSYTNSKGQVEVHRLLSPPPSSPGPRVWCDGCFDFMHWGHANALRQAKALGATLVVGVHSDAEILRNKGPPVMNESERYLAVAACKWADETVENAPYTTTLETLDRYRIDFCVHGEDVTIDEFGNDTYGIVKAAGRYKQIKRSEGVSTTEIVGRMILMSKDHLKQHDSSDTSSHASHTAPESLLSPCSSPSLPTSQSIVQFSTGATIGNGPKLERHTAKQVVYIDGAFDLFHVGHIEALRIAKTMGDYVIVGVHADAVVNAIKGSNLPILNLHERVLSVLACRFVDEVVIGSPWVLSEKHLQLLHVAVVAHGTASDYSLSDGVPDPYETPKKLGIYRQFQSSFQNLTTTTIIQRIIDNHVQYAERQRKKAKGLQEINDTQRREWEAKVKEAVTSNSCTNSGTNGETSRDTVVLQSNRA